ncbi:hypothetical protein RF11_05404 [Thelohanellus kitauei]|uniref:Uncharacterized protein n=1 Tax=Thelohanellus kitauei TaxID=669202 RepID=A0A0C2MKT2_THEKT|nr:hypothetical protein RF11_05404 [Thelohanellus kitauei]
MDPLLAYDEKCSLHLFFVWLDRFKLIRAYIYQAIIQKNDLLLKKLSCGWTARYLLSVWCLTASPYFRCCLRLKVVDQSICLIATVPIRRCQKHLTSYFRDLHPVDLAKSTKARCQQPICMKTRFLRLFRPWRNALYVLHLLAQRHKIFARRPLLLLLTPAGLTQGIAALLKSSSPIQLTTIFKTPGSARAHMKPSIWQPKTCNPVNPNYLAFEGLKYL